MRRWKEEFPPMFLHRPITTPPPSILFIFCFFVFSSGKPTPFGVRGRGLTSRNSLRGLLPCWCCPFVTMWTTRVRLVIVDVLCNFTWLPPYGNVKKNLNSIFLNLSFGFPFILFCFIHFIFFFPFCCYWACTEWRDFWRLAGPGCSVLMA